MGRLGLEASMLTIVPCWSCNTWGLLVVFKVHKYSIPFPGLITKLYLINSISSRPDVRIIMISTVAVAVPRSVLIIAFWSWEGENF